jgi:hypothetical protein
MVLSTVKNIINHSIKIPSITILRNTTSIKRSQNKCIQLKSKAKEQRKTSTATNIQNINPFLIAIQNGSHSNARWITQKNAIQNGSHSNARWINRKNAIQNGSHSSARWISKNKAIQNGNQIIAREITK